MVVENTFYFSINAQFKNDYDVSKLEKIFGIKARKLIYLKDSLGPIKTAKFLFSTREFEDVYTDKLFAEFVDNFYKKAKQIREEIEANSGSLNFCIVFKNLVKKPTLFMSNTTLTQLSEMGASYDIDFI